MGRKIMLAIDGSEFSNKSYEWTKQIILPEDELVLTHVRADLAAELVSVMNESTGTLIAQIEQETEQASKVLVGKFEGQCKADGINYSSLMLKGDAKQQIVRAVREADCALLVIGSRGLGAMGRLFLGSVSDYCLHHCHSPVLIVR
eukprot:JP438526.1.p1 GENE.JP438526.1~~JP438526.1.p1  ORF type:complete len:146 (-),score=19.92 JP438526.1:23-460(-)